MSDVLNMPMRMFHGLYYILYVQMSTEDGKKELQSQAMEDVFKGLAGT